MRRAFLFHADDVFYLRLVVETEFAFRGEGDDTGLCGVYSEVAAEGGVFARESVEAFLADDDGADFRRFASVKLHA